ncbi:hypothetical protein [Kozakia baliensis]|uniref:hypothetical protein n=1 Tax=Kozakia baliensis TaxID=153496 RepID=UPI0004977EA2|nr:hypothetical protein [Kozakia baliensis]
MMTIPVLPAELRSPTGERYASCPPVDDMSVDEIYGKAFGLEVFVLHFGAELFPPIGHLETGLMLLSAIKKRYETGRDRGADRDRLRDAFDLTKKSVDEMLSRRRGFLAAQA